MSRPKAYSKRKRERERERGEGEREGEGEGRRREDTPEETAFDFTLPPGCTQTSSLDVAYQLHPDCRRIYIFS